MAKRALCVGINNYPGTSSDLSGCVNDANDWKAVLERNGFTVDTLLDKNAFKEAMVSALQRLVKQANMGDTLVFQYSGHGSWIPDLDGDEPDERDEVLCPHDVAQNRPLSDDELFDIFSERERGVRIIFVSDSCHSGTVARLAPPLAPAENPSRIRFLPPATFLPADTLRGYGARRGRVSGSSSRRHASLLMAGCQDTEYSYDAWFNGRPNGAFTFAAIKALKSLAAGSTYRDWYLNIRKHLPTAEHPQTPNIHGSYRQRRWKVFE